MATLSEYAVGNDLKFIRSDRNVICDEICEEPIANRSTVGNLPISRYRNQFLYLLEKYNVVIVSGETGSGKSSQIPQFLLQNRWNRICMAEPRRLSAVSLAHFISMERSCMLGDEVGYMIRFEHCVTSSTKLTLTTVGLLLRSFLYDPLLSKYELVIVDEVHERSADIDLLLGLLKKVLNRRSDLKIVLMSATIDYKFFVNFFKKGQKDEYVATSIIVEERQFPIKIFHLAQAIPDYEHASFLAIVKIHEENCHDPGGILCFLPGEAEIRRVFSRLLDYANSCRKMKMCVTTLYAALSHAKKLNSFKHYSKNVRKVVLATSIAETCLTVPDIVFVVDSGFTRIRVLQENTFEVLTTTPIFKETSIQRAGRAGRIRTGYCYRLYTKDFELKPFIPEIQRVDLTSFIIQLLAVGVQNICRFDLPSPPPANSVLSGLNNLIALKVVDSVTGILTPSYGEKVAELPLSAEYAVLLLRSEEFNCTMEMLDIVSVLQVKDIFFSRTKKLKFFGSKEGDIITALNAMKAFSMNPNSGFCNQYGLNFDALSRALQIREQLKKLLLKFKMSVNSSCSPETDNILKCFVVGMFKNAAIRKGNDYVTVRGQKYVRLHRNSVYHNMFPPPVCVIFHYLCEDDTMYEVSLVKEITWLSELVSHYYEFGTARQFSLAI